MSSRVHRCDFGRLQPPERLANGWLKADAYFTRAGVFLYANGDGTTRRELRPRDEVFKPESLATLQMVPLTNTHPATPLDAENTRAFQVGQTGERIDRDGDFVAGRLMVTDAATIAAMEAGDLRELSCGYTCELELTAGTFEGEPYDAVQHDIQYNHVALVPEGRAGPFVRVRLDASGDPKSMLQVMPLLVRERRDPGEDTVTDPNRHTLRFQRFDDDGDEDGFGSVALTEEAMGPVQELIDRHTRMANRLGAALTAHEDMKTRHAALQKDAESKDATIAELQKTLAAANRNVEESRARGDTLDAELKKAQRQRDDALDPRKRQEAIAARVTLEREAADVLGADVRFDAKSDLDVRREVIAKVLPEIRLDGRSDDYVNAVYDMALAQRADNPAFGGTRIVLADPAARADAGAAGERAVAAYTAMLKRNEDAATHPLAASSRRSLS